MLLWPFTAKLKFRPFQEGKAPVHSAPRAHVRHLHKAQPSARTRAYTFTVYVHSDASTGCRLTLTQTHVRRREQPQNRETSSSVPVPMATSESTSLLQLCSWVKKGNHLLKTYSHVEKLCVDWGWGVLAAADVPVPGQRSPSRHETATSSPTVDDAEGGWCHGCSHSYTLRILPAEHQERNAHLIPLLFQTHFIGFH